MTLVAQRYERRGVLAIDPKALSETFIVDNAAPPRVNIEVGDCVVVDIRGPLEAHAHPIFDSYEDIAQRVAAACETTARAVILRFDSPGGDVTGCFDTALALRACCDAAGKQFHAYAAGECASAAYALASQCQSITIALGSIIGSIGILSTRQDISVANAARGLRVALVMSGDRKGDGHPEMPISDAELESAQTIVDSMANVFFDLVAQGRGMKPVAVASLQARTFHGEAAVRAGLADAVGSLTTVLATVAGGGTVMAITAKAKNTMSYAELREALSAAAEGDDPNSAACRAALAAMTPEEKDGSEPDGDEAPAKEEKKDDAAAASAAAPTEESDEEKKARAAAAAAASAASATGASAEGQSAAAAYQMALKAEAKAEALRAQLAQRDEEAERARLIAEHPEMSDDMQAILRKAPIALVREHVATLAPAKPAAGSVKNPRVAATGKPVQGKDQHAPSQLPPHEKADLDARMGLNRNEFGVIQNEYKLTLGAYKTSA